MPCPSNPPVHPDEEDRLIYEARMKAYHEGMARYETAVRQYEEREAEARRQTIARARYCKQQIDYYRAAGDAELTSPEFQAAVEKLTFDINHDSSPAIRSAFREMIQPAHLHWSQNTNALMQLRHLIRQRVKHFESVTTSEGLAHILAELGADEQPTGEQPQAE